MGNTHRHTGEQWGEAHLEYLKRFLVWCLMIVSFIACTAALLPFTQQVRAQSVALRDGLSCRHLNIKTHNFKTCSGSIYVLYLNITLYPFTWTAMAAAAVSRSRGVAGVRSTKGLLFTFSLLCLVCLTSSLIDKEQLVNISLFNLHFL